MVYIKDGTPIFRKTSFAFFAAGFNTFAILYCAQPLMQEFTSEFNISPTMASLPLSLSTISLAISMLVLGSLSEVWGRKPTMVYSMLLASIFCLLTAFSPNFHVLLLLRTLLGIILAGVPSVAMAYLGEEVESSSLGKAMGLYISGNAIGAMGGRIISGVLSDFFGWHIAVGGIGIISIAATLIFAYMLRPSNNFKSQKLKIYDLSKSMAKHLKDPGLLCLYGLGFLLLGSNVALFNYIGFALTDEPYSLKQGLVSWIFLLFIIGMFSSVWIGRLADRYGRQYILIINLLLIGFGACLTLNTLLIVKIIGLGLTTFGFFGSHSIASGWVSHRAVKNKAQASSLYLFLYYTGSSIGGTLGGVFWSILGWKGLIYMVICFIIIALFLTLILFKVTGLTKFHLRKINKQHFIFKNKN
ncbi:MFS transporter [Niallia nealsonii]|uniref:MFS transporter n=1 Tax=Niallia nealsonii TaxID=115979 RepID=A0A2N0Z1T3_9BACI|nr:MFS transporter [Niallia nealsonii]PKG23471.1 MFS transporter [Niallia nealsonii]